METMDCDDYTFTNKPRKRSGDAVAFSALSQWWRRPAGVAAVCFGLLCVLLLAGIIVQGYYNNESDQMQSRLSAITTDRDQLKQSLNTTTKERDQLQSSLSTMTTERDQLKQSLNTKTKERDQLQISLSTMTTERDQLQKNLNTGTTERNDLQQSLTTMTKERDQLQNSHNVLTAERDQLKNTLNSRTKERVQLQNILDTTTTERDELKKKLRFYVLISETPCPEGWWKFGTSCYYLSSTKDTGGAGQRACRAMGAEDVVINSREEQLFIHGLKKNVWIGLFKKDTSWIWVDKTKVTSMYWMQGEPNNLGGEENCVEITRSASDPMKSWNDVSCGTKIFSVCEKKVSTQ